MSSLYSNSIRLDHNKNILHFIIKIKIRYNILLNLTDYFILLRKVLFFSLAQYILYSKYLVPSRIYRISDISQSSQCNVISFKLRNDLFSNIHHSCVSHPSNLKRILNVYKTALAFIPFKVGSFLSPNIEVKPCM